MSTPKPVMTVRPKIRPVTLPQAKHQLSLPQDVCENVDPKLERLILAAIETVQNDTNFQGANATFEYKLALEEASAIRLPHFNAHTIVSVAVDDQAKADGWELNTHVVTPTIVFDPPVTGEVLVTYQAGGKTTEEVAEWFVQAVLSLVDYVWSGMEGEGGITFADQIGRLSETYEAMTRRQVAVYL